MARFGEKPLAREADQQHIVVQGPKGQRATVIAVPNPHAPIDEAEIVYGMDGLTVEKISDSEFRDFQGTIWSMDSAAISR